MTYPPDFFSDSDQYELFPQLSIAEANRIRDDCRARGVPLPPEIETLDKEAKAAINLLKSLQVRYFGVLYRGTSNPVYSWYCIEFCLKQGLTLPKWVQSYLLSAATAFADIKPFSKDPEQQIYRALKFSNPDNRHSFTKASELEKQLEVVAYFLELRRHGYTWDDALEGAVEKYDKPTGTVKDWVSKYKPILQAALSPTLAS